MALGWGLRLESDAYLLIGIPLTAGFQLGVRRAPLRALWVRAAPAFVCGPLLLLLSASLAAVPLYRAWRGAEGAVLLWCLAAAGGAVGAAYALRHLRRVDVRPFLLWTAAAAAAGIVLMGLAHHSRGALPGMGPGFLRAVAFWLLLYFPVAFVLEEVAFRGALDAHVHHPEEGGGAWSALVVSALWGVWHLPLVAREPDLYLPAQALVLTLTHALVGVPLSLGWRRTGNLAGPALAHALVDAVRNALLR